MANLKELLGGDLLDETVLTMTSQVGQILELTGNYQQAGEAFALVGAPSRTMQTRVGRQAANAQPIAASGRRWSASRLVEGVNLDESPFDWSQYAGKVVWSISGRLGVVRACRKSPTSSVLTTSTRTRDSKMVGVNLDDDLQSVEQFLGPQPLPWRPVVGPDSDGARLL